MSARTTDRTADPAAVATAMGARVRTETADVFSAIGRWRIPELILFFGLIFEGALFGLPRRSTSW